jgi:hypothetical protein
MGAKEVKPCRPRRPRRPRKPTPDSPQLAILAALVAAGPWGAGEREHQFHPARKWRFDLAWPALMVAFECEGGVWGRGRHTSGAGYSADCEKYSIAAALGWTVIRATTQQIRQGAALDWLTAALMVAMGGPVPAGFGERPRTIQAPRRKAR